MRWDSFGRTLLFGALAALGWLAVATLPLPTPHLHALYGLACAVVYAAGLGQRRLAAAALAAGLAAALLVAASGAREITFGAACLLALVRSGFAYRGEPLRGLALETGLVLGGLAAARALGAPGALGIWGFFLVQSLFFLVGGGVGRPAPAGEDPFDRARARLERLLEGPD